MARSLAIRLTVFGFAPVSRRALGSHADFGPPGINLATLHSLVADGSRIPENRLSRSGGIHGIAPGKPGRDHGV